VQEVRLLAAIGNPHVEADLIVAVEALTAALAGAVATARADLDILSAHRAADDRLDGRFEAFERQIHEMERARTEVDRLASALGPGTRHP
jgi:hypothetical protein